MSLLLNGAKTATIAGTELQCIEIYTGESYTLPIAFTDSVGTPVDISTWTLTPTAKWYTCNITGDTANNITVTEIDITDLTLIAPQPSAPAGLTAAKISGGTGGLAYLFVPTTLSGGTGSPNPSPVVSLNDTTSLLVIITLTVSRTDPTSGSTDINREPIGIIIRYQ